jgi:hypothetical protein
MRYVPVKEQTTKIPLAEKDFQRAVIDYAKLRNWLVFHDTDSRKNSRGLPDLILCRPGRDGKHGRLAFVELKTDRGRLRPEQKEWLEALATVSCVETYVFRPSQWQEIERILR